MSDRTQVVVFPGPGQRLEVRDVARPVPCAGEVLVAVDLATVCGSDIHTHTGRRQGPQPCVLGHEAVGRVAALPPGEAPRDLGGHPLQPGDRVVWSLAASCGGCFFCLRGLPQKCESLFKYGHEALTPGRELTGTFATHVLLVRGTPVVRVPPGLPDVVACPAGLATATVAAVLRAAGPVAGCVLVLGAGMLGLTACALARARGAEVVVACDLAPARQAQALTFGATLGLAPGEELTAAVRSLTGGRGADVVLELTGSSEALEQGVALARTGGTVVLAGAVFPSRPVGLLPEQVVRRMLTLRGVHNYAPEDLAQALQDLVALQGRYPFADLVGPTFALAQADEAFAEAATSRWGRVALRPTGG